MTDLLLQAWVAALIERTKVEWMLGRGKSWKPGEPLKLLFVGYNGNRNTGSDVRVEEMLRQVRQVLGAKNIELTTTVFDLELSRGYFGDAAQVRLPDMFPPFLYKEVRRHHGVIACEGSMFKSKFANALTTMFIGALGMAAVENKLSIGYGAEAGYMDPSLARLCARYCHNSVVVTRNAESQTLLSALGVETELGTDTAWTFEPHPPEYGRKALSDAGWDGQAPVLILCPINPFFWPVKASTLKWAAHGIAGAYKASHYRGPYFHKSGAEVDASYKQYLDAFAKVLEAARQKHRMFPVLAACERLDAHACRAIAERAGGAPVFSSEDYDMYQLVSILRAGHLMISSRYHGIVTSMPALVPSAGVTMDERIRNLMQERGHEPPADERGRPGAWRQAGSQPGRFAARTGSRGGRNRPHRGQESEGHGAHGSLPGAHRARALPGIPHPGGRKKLGKLSSAVADEFEAAGGVIRQPRANDGGELKRGEHPK